MTCVAGFICFTSILWSSKHPEEAGKPREDHGQLWDCTKQSGIAWGKMDTSRDHGIQQVGYDGGSCASPPRGNQVNGLLAPSEIQTAGKAQEIVGNSQETEQGAAGNEQV